MTTPSKYRRLEEAANLYVEYCVVAQQLCKTIVNMHGKLDFDDDIDEQSRRILTAVTQRQEQAFKAQLMPYIERLQELDARITNNVKDVTRKIILPEDIQ